MAGAIVQIQAPVEGDLVGDLERHIHRFGCRSGLHLGHDFKIWIPVEIVRFQLQLLKFYDLSGGNGREFTEYLFRREPVVAAYRNRSYPVLDDIQTDDLTQYRLLGDVNHHRRIAILMKVPFQSITGTLYICSRLASSDKLLDLILEFFGAKQGTTLNNKTLDGKKVDGGSK